MRMLKWFVSACIDILNSMYIDYLLIQLYRGQLNGCIFMSYGLQQESGLAAENTLILVKKKQMTNTRSSGSDEALRLSPPKILSLEQALEFIDTDELLEVTPKSLRIRKKILDPTMRKRAGFRKS